jgi:hypothetical protein
MGLSQIPGELKKEISPDISSSKKKGMLSFLDSRHAPFWPLSSASNDTVLLFHRFLTPPHWGGGVLSSNMKIKLLELLYAATPVYFLVASGAAGAGAGVAAGAAGAGASAGFASSLGFSGALALHPIPIETTLITKTMAKKR